MLLYYYLLHTGQFDEFSAWYLVCFFFETIKILIIFWLSLKKNKKSFQNNQILQNDRKKNKKKILMDMMFTVYWKYTGE